MSQKMVVLVGPKQSGKSSAANFITGYTLTQFARRAPKETSLPTDFSMDEEGNLLVNAVWKDAEGAEKHGMGILDLNRRDDPQFVAFLSRAVWPVVRTYNFADTLKEVSNQIFGLDYEKMYGTDDDKNEETHISWEGMRSLMPPRVKKQITEDGRADRNMTYREFMEYFGTKICRAIQGSCWVDACFSRIAYDNSGIAIIADGRFQNEVERAREFGAKIIRLKRRISEEVLPSEAELDKMPSDMFDVVIDNSEMSLHDKNQIILDAMFDWGWFDAHVSKQEEVAC